MGDGPISSTVIGVFTEEQAARLSRLSVSQLRYWNRTGFFKPEISDPDAGGAFNRLYSFRNVVGLRVLGVLRRDFSISLQHLRKIAEKLEYMDQSLWNKLTLFVRGREVCTMNGAGGFSSIVSGESTLPHLPLPRVASDVEAEASKMRQRSNSDEGRIARSRSIARNAEVFAGTRIPVSVVREYLQSGYSEDDILAEYPTLTRADIEMARQHFRIDAA
jgi:uncharacterized protein (DUF433 family)